MESKSFNVFKIIATAICAVLAIGGMVLALLFGDGENHIYSMVSVGVCFVLSLVFMRLNAKQILLTAALGANTIALAFFVYVPNVFNGLLEVCLQLFGELCLVIYTVWMIKGTGLKITSLAVRVGLCMLAYFVLPNYIAITIKEMLVIMLMLNQLTTVVILAFNFKKEWLTLLGMLALLISSLFAWLTSGGINLFGITQFIEFLYVQDWSFIFKVPALFVLAVSSAWASKRQKITESV